MKTVVTLAASSALAMGALVATPVSAAPAPPASDVTVAPRAAVKKSFTVFGKFTDRQVVRYGNANGIGNLTITTGSVSDGLGKKVGTLTTVIRVVAPSPKKDAELRDTQSQIKLKDGQIFAQAVNEDPKDGPPKSLHIMSVTGGTGAYASARGTLIIYPYGDKYRMAYDLFIDKNLKQQTFSFGSVDQASAQGDAPKGVGDVSLLRGTGTDDSYVLIATTAGARIDAVDMQVFTDDGSLFARTIARSRAGAPQASTFAVLGGTGSFAGYRGELTLSADGESIRAKLSAPSGKGKRLTWFEDAGRNVASVDIPGGTMVGGQGSMLKAAGSKKKVGSYFVSRITYDEVGGVTPILTMMEQEFNTGTMIITGITLSTGEDGVPATRPIVGGTGDYGGAAGQAASVRESGGDWRKNARFWR